MSEVPTIVTMPDAEMVRQYELLAARIPDDHHWEVSAVVIKRLLRLALSALDAQKAAGEGVTEELVQRAHDAALASVIVDGGNAADNGPPVSAIRAALLAVHPAIFAAGERAGLEKAKAKLLQGAAYNGLMEEETKEGVIAMLFTAWGELRSLKGGTP